MRGVVLSALLLVASSAAVLAEEPKAAALKFTKFQNENDSGTVEIADGKAVLRVKCPRGIGHCTVAAEKGKWPEHVTLLFEGFDELEHFGLSTGRMTAQGARKSSGAFELYFLDDDRDFNKRSRVGTLDIKVEQQKEGVLVVFPGKLFADADTVSFGWINWLRR